MARLLSALLTGLFAAMLLIPAMAHGQRPPPPDLPDLPATPQMSQTGYPECREDWRRYGEPYEQAAETNRCTAALDRYHAQVLMPFTQQLIAHQNAIRGIYEEQVQNDFRYTQEQADGFYARVTAEHEASNLDGAHAALYREMLARYEGDRAYQQAVFCRMTDCRDASLLAALPADLDAGGGGGNGERSARRRDGGDGDQCGTERAGGGLLGGILGGVIGSRTGLGSVAGSLIGAASGTLLAQIACNLTEEEQELAAEATVEVTEQEEVGARSEWTSPTREGVSGSSEVTAMNSQPNGTRCLTITDIAIIDGEEISLEKEMCRAPGESRYTLNA
ncbi:hypothetical protein [uncultured Parasphingopyxis sp.]|uniref:hypothetical protein n=1 Tax=uncultured Parasphingopyxis sp. TaxID=1547918 RepID=UPI0026346E1E|nr:hypothetical protein [uncultured Parasphingopyxis sp.]